MRLDLHSRPATAAWSKTQRIKRCGLYQWTSVFAICCFAVSCASPPPVPDEIANRGPLVAEAAIELKERVQGVSQEPTIYEAAPMDGDTADVQTRTAEIYYGDQSFIDGTASPDGVAERPKKETSRGGESFVFRNAPIDAVVNEVLGEAFGLSYSVAPDVNGSITLRLDGITKPEEAVASLGAALSMQGLIIKEASGNYLVSKVGRTGSKDIEDQPVFLAEGDTLPTGASLAVLQVQYAKVLDVTELARTMIPSGLIRHVDQSSGIVVLHGEPGAVASGVQLLKSLDVNWLDSVSTALLPVENALPSEVSADLEPILSKIGGVSVVPLERLGALMVVSRRRDSLDQVHMWVKRLDRDAKPKLTSDTLVYEARYVSAEYLRDVLGQAEDQRPNPNINGSIGPNAQVNNPLSSTARQAPRQSGGLYADVMVSVDASRNAIIARGDLADLKSLSALYESIDQPQRQVLIEATIVEVGLTENNQFGVQWDVVAGQFEATFTDVASGAVAGLFPGASLAFVNSDVETVVNALAVGSDIEIVSSPRLLVLNNESARLQIGDQVPIITQSAVSITDPGAPIVNSTSYRDTGVILVVTPSIRAGGMVEIEISQEVSGVAETTTSSIDSPTITQRSIETRLAVPDGSTAVIGGLMSSNIAYSELGVPLLKDIPLLGKAFRSTSQNERRTELVVLIEPTVILSAEPAIDIPKRLRDALIEARRAF